MLLQATNTYSITVSQEFANQFWKKELTQIVYELYPGIMNTLKTINFKVYPELEAGISKQVSSIQYLSSKYSAVSIKQSVSVFSSQYSATSI